MLVDGGSGETPRGTCRGPPNCRKPALERLARHSLFDRYMKAQPRRSGLTYPESVLTLPNICATCATTSSEGCQQAQTATATCEPRRARYSHDCLCDDSHNVCRTPISFFSARVSNTVLPWAETARQPARPSFEERGVQSEAKRESSQKTATLSSSKFCRPRRHLACCSRLNRLRGEHKISARCQCLLFSQ